MSTTRRGLLAAILGVAAAPAIARASSLMPLYVPTPVLYGDGEHDDTEALRAALRGERVRDLSGVVSYGYGWQFPDGRYDGLCVKLLGGTFYVPGLHSRVLELREGNWLENCDFWTVRQRWPQHNNVYYHSIIEGECWGMRKELGA